MWGDSWTRLPALPEPTARCLLLGGQEKVAAPVWGCRDLGILKWGKEDPSLPAKQSGRGVEGKDRCSRASSSACPVSRWLQVYRTNPSVY